MTELFLIAHVAGRGVAFPADEVDSVVDLGDLVEVPKAGPSVRGLAALRSRVVTVIDTGTALGLPSLTGTSRAVITRVDGHYYAILVDALEDIAPFERQAVSFDRSVSHSWRAATSSIVERDGEPLVVLDLDALIPSSALAA